MASKFAGQDVASWVGIGAPTGQAHVARPGGGVATPSAGKIESKDAQDVVRTMQDLMGDLGRQLNDPQTAQNIASKYNVAPDSIKAQAVKFSRTAASAPRAAPNDGTWGSNTREALVAIKNFVASLKIPGVIITEGEGHEPFHAMKEQDLVAQAKNNINNLFRLFSELGIESHVAGGAGAEGVEVIDSIEANLPDDAIENPFRHWGNVPVTKGDVASFYAFFKFMQRLSPPWDCTPLGEKKKASEEYVEKLAKEILDRTIVRIGQLPSASVPIPAGEEAPSAAQPKRGVLCVSVIDKIIDWFFQRAKVMYIELHDALVASRPSPRPDRKQDRVIAQGDVALGQYYVDKMGDILAAWDANKDAIIAALRNEGKSDTDPVTLKTLRDAEGGRATGQAHRQRGEGGEEGTTGRTVKGRIPPEGPLADFMSLSDFEGYSDSLDRVAKLSAGGRLPEIDMRQWRTGAWTTFAQEVVAGKDDAEKYRNFGPWAAAVRDSLKEVYNWWADQRHNRGMLRDQYDLLNRWVYRINSVISTWNTEYAQPMARATQGR